MLPSSTKFSARLFYSYCHEDSPFRDEMQKTLSLLKREGVLDEWYDHLIVPGENIDAEVKAHLQQSDIVVFLFSRDFIASDACMKEWAYAKDLELSGKSILRIPIIVRQCEWLQVLGTDSVKALPLDGKAVSTYNDPDEAWREIYQGVRMAVEKVRGIFSPKPDFIREVEKTEFFSREDIKLKDLYTFLTLTRHDLRSDLKLTSTDISTASELLSTQYAIIHGQEKTGKTTLARFLYLSLVEQSKPVLLLDSSYLERGRPERRVREAYQEQFHGDYSLWAQQQDKTLILDGLTENPRALTFVAHAKEIFDRIIITVPTDVFYAYFRDEERLMDFQHLKIQPLTAVQQEQLIRQRLELLETPERPVTDGLIDQVEAQVNSVVISNKVVPRYPFYVLSILQTHESDMPANMTITSYGHCYYVLIVASLIRAGVSRSDHAINACLNFAEELSFATYQHRMENLAEEFDFNAFEERYRRQFIIDDAIIARLKHPQYGIINQQGDFRSAYMYYFFLARYLATHLEQSQSIIEMMCEESHKQQNYLTLLFTIHHVPDSTIIDHIIQRSKDTLSSIAAATLIPHETSRFTNIVAKMPDSILSQKSISDSRHDERLVRGEIQNDDLGVDALDEDIEFDIVNDVYRVLKGNKILGQVLRSRYSNIERTKVEEIIEVVAESGLRLVNALLVDDDEMTKIASYISNQRPEWDIDRIRRGLEFMSFMWTMLHVEEIVSAIHFPQIREVVEGVVEKRENPAYDLIGYFSHLDSIEKLRARERTVLRRLWRRHDDSFLRCVISLRTQYYMNTHESDAPDEQAICSVLGIPYVARLRSGRGRSNRAARRR